MRMDLWLNIVLIVGPLLLGTYLSTVQEITGSVKIVVWIICLFICISDVYRVIREKERENKERYYHQLQERQELYSRGLPTSYINGLGENPVLQRSFNMGQRYEKEFKYNEAIEEYGKYLSHPEATKENKVAANILIGNCYYGLSKLKEAEKHYKKALSESKRVKDKAKKLQGKVVALGNTGLVRRDLGNPDEALKYYKEALEIHKKIGYKQWIANDLNNIGLIRRDLGKPGEALNYHKKALEIYREIGYELGIADALNNIGLIRWNLGFSNKALKYYKEALEIHKKIGYEPGIADALGNTGLVHRDLGNPDEALNYHKEALKIDRKIGYEWGIASDLNNIGLVHRDLGNPDEALNYHKEALKIFKHIGAQPQIEIVLKNISTIEEKKERTPT